MRLPNKNTAHPGWNLEVNELIFFAHFALILISVSIATRVGKYALFTLFLIMVTFANLFVLKEITLFGLTVTAVEPYTIGAMIAIGLLQELHGKAIAKQALSSMLLFLAFMGVMSIVHIAYIPSAEDTFHPAYTTILSNSPRIFLSSIFVAVSMHALNLFLLDKTKNYLTFSVRQPLILLFVQLLDTVLFSFVGLYGIMSNLTHICVMSYTIKMITIGLMSPAMALIKKYVRTPA